MKLFPIFIALLIASSACFAYGVSPAKKILNTPGEHTFTIIARHAGETGVITIRAEGDLAHAIRFDKTSAQFLGDVSFTGTITIPDKMTPGDHEQKIIVSVASSENGVMSAAVETVSLLIVRQSYPGTFLVADVHVAPDGGRDAATVYISIENRGNKRATPQVSLLREQGELAIPVSAIQPRETVQASVELFGRGEEEITLLITGANEVRKPFTVAIGHPKILSLTARAQPDQGIITPIVVETTIDWNKPAHATLVLDGKSYTLIINGSHTATYYAETNASTVKLALHVGRESQIIDVVLQTSSPVSAETLQWKWVALFLLLVLLAVTLYRNVRKK